MFESCHKCEMPLLNDVQECPKCGEPVKSAIGFYRILFSVTALVVVVARSLD